MSRMHTRCVQRRDLKYVVEIERLSYGSTAVPNRPRSLQQLDKISQNKFFTVVEIDKKIVAFATGARYKNQFEISSVAVHPRWRGHELGKNLVKRLMALAAKDLYKQARCYISYRNKRALNMLQALNFKRVGTIVDKYGKSEHAIVLTRKLDRKS